MDWAAVFGPAALVPLFSATVRMATPTALAALGDAISQRAGVLNLGLEGVMLGGAFGGFLGAHLSNSPAVGVLGGAASGMLVAVVVSWFVVHLRCDRIVAGVAVLLMVEGLTAFALHQLYGDRPAPPTVPRLPSVGIPFFEHIPGIGPTLFQLDALGYLVPVAAFGTWYLVNRTGFGLRIRAVGGDEKAASMLMVPVRSTQTVSLVMAGAITGIGGAVLVVSQVGLFSVNMTAGRGFLAIAIVLIGRARPGSILAASLLFGFLEALQLRVQLASGGTSSAVPYELFQALPYIATIAVVAGAARVARRGRPLSLATTS